jgi:hypothetical protein
LTAKWCDLSCPHAHFPGKTALAGACNTMQAIYCRKYRTLRAKNAPCMEKKGGKGR